MIGEISETFCFVCKYTGIRLFLFSARPTILFNFKALLGLNSSSIKINYKFVLIGIWFLQKLSIKYCTLYRKKSSIGSEDLKSGQISSSHLDPSLYEFGFGCVK